MYVYVIAQVGVKFGINFTSVGWFFFSVNLGHFALGAKIIIRCLFSQSRSQFSTNFQGITVNVNK